ncbi:MAG: CoB--CoM heterodisulfide reductase iron-sulfur subunit A family protein [Desulfamplus sp.]|nr:CoB--CoM heterodisulfide reductase iron-sulfur subunit A family protein [Desulfamplus sp.]
MKSILTKSFDVMVIGGGIAGLQSALDIADQGYKVAIVEKGASVGGKMIRLSKVFPTLDCASCITTPKMAAAAHHNNITIFTCCDVKSVNKEKTIFQTVITQNPRYVDTDKCIGCRKCEYECPVLVSDLEQGGFSATKAISIPFSNAIPQIAVLDSDNCMLCGRCEKICPTQAINYFEKPSDFVVEAKAVVVATGYEMTPLSEKPQYGMGLIPNFIDALQMERLLAPHGPYNRVLRPSDGKEPDSIAYIQCAGSRDRSMGVSYCSRFCCMYAIKQAMLLSGSLPLAEIRIYYMDIRAFGKGYEQFYQNAKAMGIEFVKAKVARVDAGEDGSVIVQYEDQNGDGMVTMNHDLVVASMGVISAWSPKGICNLEQGLDNFIHTVNPKLSPTLTAMEGIFVAGAAAGPKDIVDTITEAGAAAIEVSKYLRSLYSKKSSLKAILTISSFKADLHRQENILDYGI